MVSHHPLLVLQAGDPDTTTRSIITSFHGGSVTFDTPPTAPRTPLLRCPAESMAAHPQLDTSSVPAPLCLFAMPTPGFEPCLADGLCSWARTRPGFVPGDDARQSVTAF